MIGEACYAMLDRLCPMHIVLTSDGHIRSAGPTTLKVCGHDIIGAQFLSIFEIKRPREITSLAALLETAGRKLNLQFRAPPHRALKGVLMPGPAPDETIVNMSFGISIVDAVQKYNLTAADFAPTDLTVEMLYLVEAKSAAMDASRQLNERLQRARIEAEQQALTDTLTGLANRRGMDQSLARLLSNGENFSVMHLDLDLFKGINDTFGHAAGDFVLQHVARIMSSEVRDSDLVSRVGGDEFVILLAKSPDAAILEDIAGRIISLVSQPVKFEGNLCKVSASVGVSFSKGRSSPTDADELLNEADTALYAAKNAGRGRVVFFEPTMRGVSKMASSTLGS